MADDPLQVTWAGVGRGVFDLEVTLRGDAGEATTALTGIVMGEDGADPRLATWRPQVDFTVMQVSLEHVKSHPDDAPERFVLGVGVGSEGRAFACAPQPLEDSDERWLHGPYLVVQRAATAATLFAFEERTGEVSAPIVDGDVTLTLPDRLGLSVDRLDGGPEPGGRGSEIFLVRVEATDEWRPDIPPLGFDFHVIALAGSGYVNQASAPGAGRYRWVFDRGEPATATFEIPPGDAHPRYTIELLPHR